MPGGSGGSRLGAEPDRGGSGGMSIGADVGSANGSPGRNDVGGTI
jgi:hypothetical protein